MKKHAFLSTLLVLVALLPGALRAELAKTGNGPLGPFVAAPEQQVFVNILGLAYGFPALGYEKVIGDENSFTGQIGFRGVGGGGYYLNYLGLLGSYRWWLGHHANLQGFYLGPQASIQIVDAAYDVRPPSGPLYRERGSGTVIGVGAEGGYQWVLPAHVTLGLGLSLGYNLGAFDVPSGGPSFLIGGPASGLTGSVGYAF